MMDLAKINLFGFNLLKEKRLVTSLYLFSCYSFNIPGLKVAYLAVYMIYDSVLVHIGVPHIIM